jgi:hypothetical protein
VQMADRASEIARYLIDEQWTGADEVFAEVPRRWPGLTREEWDSLTESEGHLTAGWASL